MEMHQAGQEETLVEVMVETNSLEVGHRSRGSPGGRRGCFKCAVALATMMGLVIVALVGGFILHIFMFTPLCNQDAPPLNDTAKVIKTCHLKKSNERGTYDIFTADKAATYLIYGWMKFSDVTGKDVTLRQTWGEDHITINIQRANKPEIFFFDRIKMAKDIRINIYLHSNFTESLFHVYEL